MRRLILNADDFGLTTGVNQAIVEAHTQGVLTSATLMANAGQTEAAIELAKGNATLAVGCHVVLVDGEPLTNPSDIPSLIAPGTRRFYSNINSIAARAITGHLSRDEIEAEATAQFRRLRSAGISPTHFDTHKHAHMFPTVLEGILRSARTCGVAALRNPFEPPQTLPPLLAARGMRKRMLETSVLRSFRPQFQELVRRSGLKTTDGTVGIAVTGRLDQTELARIVSTLPQGTWELVLHPGYDDDALRAAGTRLRESREIELQLLTSAQTRDLLDRTGIRLISYRDL